jgi:hypothetical protein
LPREARHRLFALGAADEIRGFPAVELTARSMHCLKYGGTPRSLGAQENCIAILA